jgi:hypothetical protein
MNDNELEFIRPRAEQEETASNQREYTRLLADRVESGESLSSWERKWIAAILRGAAYSIQPPKGNRGPSPKLDPGSLAMEYAILRELQGYTGNAAHELLADKYFVSREAIKKALEKYGDVAVSMIRENQ